jgi:hydrogenase nickel incorporation protein HypA/HybF
VHEYSIVAELVARAGREAAIRAGRVHRLHVAIGELAGVDLDLLRTAFETFRERSACDGADLEIRPVSAAWQCSACERSLAPGARLRCPDCGRPARLVQGDEIVLERIELEVPDV